MMNNIVWFTLFSGLPGPPMIKLPLSHTPLDLTQPEFDTHFTITHRWIEIPKNDAF